METDKELLEELSIETTNLISFEKLSNRKIKEQCPHLSVTINESLSEVSCNNCGQSLNPMWVIRNYAEHQKSMYAELRKQLIRTQNVEKKLRDKKRTKCTHCGRFTKVNINMTDSQWMGLDVVK